MPDATLEILIQIRDELAGLNRTREGLASAKKEAEGFGTVLRQGLGIGTGMELARRGIELLRETISETVGEAFRLAGEIRDNSEALAISGEAYQVFKNELKDGGLEMGRMVMAITTANQALAQARDGVTTYSAAFDDLNLSLDDLEKMTPDQRILAVAHAALTATDQTRAYYAAGLILGQRGIPQLLSALKNLSTEGYGKLSAAMKEAGRIMDDDTAAALDRAEKAFEHFKQRLVIIAGESVASVGTIGSFLDKHPTLGLLAQITSPFGATLFHAATPPPEPPRQPPPAGPIYARPEDTLQVRIANAEAKASALSSASLLTETEKRQALLPVLKEQEQFYQKLIDTKYGDLKGGLPENGEVTDEQLQRYKERNELEYKLTAIRQQRMQAVDTPLAALWREMSDTTTIVNAALAQGISAGVQQLGSDIWEALKHTESWGEAWRNLGDMAGRILTQIITQMLIVQSINAALGLFGYNLQTGVGGTVTIGTMTDAGAVDFAAAGGGSFVTSGPTHFTVGDNPGGVELVHVIPLSGIGQTTVRGQALRMAGGGAALVAGGGSRTSGDVINFSQTLNFGGGVSRQDLLAAIPSIVQASKAAVLDAQRRKRDGF